MKKIIAIDFSITSPALTLWNEEDDTYKIICFDKKNAGSKFKLMNGKYLIVVLEPIEHKIDLIRFDQLQRRILKVIGEDFIKNSEIAIEGYSFGASGQLTRIAEACMLLKYNLYKAGADKDIKNYAPMSVKKFATGTGKASKLDMVDSFKEKTGIDLFDLLGKKEGLKTIPVPITDIVDSFWIGEFHKSK